MCSILFLSACMPQQEMQEAMQDMTIHEPAAAARPRNLELVLEAVAGGTATSSRPRSVPGSPASAKILAEQERLLAACSCNMNDKCHM